MRENRYIRKGDLRDIEIASPPLDLLDTFVAVAREGNLTRAAKARHLTVSALSHRLRRMEAELGVRLLNRSTRSVAPTEAGERLLARLGPALADIEAGLTEVAEFRERPAGRLRLNVPRSAARLAIGNDARDHVFGGRASGRLAEHAPADQRHSKGPAAA